MKNMMFHCILSLINDTACCLHHVQSSVYVMAGRSSVCLLVHLSEPGSDRWLHRPRWVGWLVRYLDIFIYSMSMRSTACGAIYQLQVL